MDYKLIHTSITHIQKGSFYLMGNIQPGVKFLFISGYAAYIIMKTGINEEGMHFIQKPISPESFLGKVREILDLIKL